MINFIENCENPFKLFEKIEKSLDKNLKIFVETNEKLTSWYIHVNDDFIKYTIKSLLEYNQNDLNSWNIDIVLGTISLKRINKEWPNLQLSLYNQNKPSLYYSKTETIFLNILNNDLLIPEFIIYNIMHNGTIIQNIILHELTHYHDDLMLKGKGLQLKNKNGNYYNSFSEINAYTKQTIDLMEKYFIPVINSIMINSNNTLEEEFSHILHTLLSKVISTNMSIKNFFNALDEKKRKNMYIKK